MLYSSFTPPPPQKAPLFTAELLPCLLHQNSSNRPPRLSSNPIKLEPNLLPSGQHETTDPKEFFAVELGESMQKLETLGCHNSLFLAVARALLFKIHYENQNYVDTLRKACFSDVDFIPAHCFDSDLALQELLRRALCLFWLRTVKQNYSNLSNTKYGFSNAYDFVFEICQMAINNFSGNSLFTEHALHDLATLIRKSLHVFNMTTRAYKVYEPVIASSEIITDKIHLAYNEEDTVKFKWLMPNRFRPFFDRISLAGQPGTDNEASSGFFQFSPVYKQLILVVSTREVCECFRASLNEVKTMLFVCFLSDSCVRTFLMDGVSFESRLESDEALLSYLNEIWGRRYFSFEEAKLRIDFLTRRKTASKRVSIEPAMISINEHCASPKKPREDVIRTPLLTNLITHNLPPISPKTRRRSFAGIDNRSTVTTQVQKPPPSTFYSPQFNQLAYPGATTQNEKSISQLSATAIRTNLTTNSSSEKIEYAKTPAKKLNIITRLNTGRSTTTMVSFNSWSTSYGSFIDSININSTTNNLN